MMSPMSVAGVKPVMPDPCIVLSASMPPSRKVATMRRPRTTQSRRRRSGEVPRWASGLNPPGLGPAISKIGMYMAIRITPTMPPITTIIIGSRSDVRAATATSTSSS